MDSSIELIGLLATILGVFSFIPIVYLVYKTKDTDNFPHITLALAIITNILWSIYGYFNATFSTFIYGICYVFIYSFILIVKVYN